MSRVFDAMRRANAGNSEPSGPVHRELLNAFPSERGTDTPSEESDARPKPAWVAGVRTQPTTSAVNDWAVDPGSQRDQQKVLGPLVPVSDEITFRELIEAIARDERDRG